MNYYPYLNQIPYMAAPVARTGLFKSLFGGIKWSSILSGTQKTLGVVNQAIPLIKQAGPIVNNAKTMFRVMSEFKKSDISNKVNDTNNYKETVSTESLNDNISNVKTTSNSSQANDNFKINTNGPTFFQ